MEEKLIVINRGEEVISLPEDVQTLQEVLDWLGWKASLGELSVVNIIELEGSIQIFVE